MADFFDNVAIAILARPGAVLSVGRHADCDVWIDDSSISKRHAAITIEDDGAHVIRDTRSTLGQRRADLLPATR